MSTWSGWREEFLTAADVLVTNECLAFLSDWASHADSDCGNNPIDLTAQFSGSTDCATLPAILAKAQHYTARGNAAYAFHVETHQGWASALLAALKSGDPYNVHYTGKVASELSAWGSQTFAERYFKETANAPGRGGGHVQAPQTLRGWNDVRHEINHEAPRVVRHSQAMMRQALRELARARKVTR